ncbi:response regulator [Geobacter pelophilus]|uniref:Response regulator n=1 Tax=Geoanaerobacter pelophilus TaxID=60036 RepID=A0AAW4L0C6_9BACT|nr:response regulator [Geoanaerobacter pelophilus]MBT0664303.1 response regulator [Geoanaerobacter pelophilus]
MQDKKKVLIIDDEELHLYTSKALLESGALEVVTYQGSFGATNYVKSVQPDLVLLDVNMPALSGENLVTLIKPWCRERRIPILFYSSNDEGILRALATDHGVQGYICKGDIPGLYKSVEEALR